MEKALIVVAAALAFAMLDASFRPQPEVVPVAQLGVPDAQCEDDMDCTELCIAEGNDPKRCAEEVLSSEEEWNRE